MAKSGKRLNNEKLVDIVGLLAALARRGSYLAAPSTSGARASASVAVVGPDATRLEFPGRALDGALHRGWIGPIGAPGSASTPGDASTPTSLGLTSEGRVALRRTRSRRVAASAQDRSAPGRLPLAGRPSENPAESPLSWLRGRRDAEGREMLTATQIAAGERLRKELTIAGMTPRVTMAWSGTPISGDRGAAAAGFGRDLADNVIAARSRVTAALRTVGPELADILIDVCAHLRGLEEIARSERWPRRSAKLILQRALSALARHYGLEPHVSAEETIAKRLRHWGSDDYRPTLSGRRGGQAA